MNLVFLIMIDIMQTDALRFTLREEGFGKIIVRQIRLSIVALVTTFACLIYLITQVNISCGLCPAC